VIVTSAATVSALVLAISQAATGPPNAAASACPALAERVSPASPALARVLTTSLCEQLVAARKLTTDDAARLQDAAALAKVATAGGTRDVLDAGTELFERAAATAVAGSTESWVTRQTPHYILLARPGTRAAADLDLVAEETELCRSGLARAWGLDDRLAARDRAIRAGLPAGVTGEVQGRIPIFLYPTRDAADGRVGRHSFGAASLAATVGDDGRPFLKPSIHVVYANALSIAVVQHEVAHLVAMIAAFDPAALDVTVKGKADLQRAFFAGYRKLPEFVNQGLADYGFYYEGMYARWGLFGPVRDLAAVHEPRLPAMTRVIEADQSFHGRDHKAFSLAAATFLRFLAEKKSAPAVGEWLLAGGQASSFDRTFGMTLAEAEQQWRAWLRAR
jgi:hypothetical protein